MRGADVQRVFETILPDKVLLKLVQSAKFQQRARKLDALRLLRAMIVAAATGYGGRQADVMRLYFKCGPVQGALGDRERQQARQILLSLGPDCCPHWPVRTCDGPCLAGELDHRVPSRAPRPVE